MCFPALLLRRVPPTLAAAASGANGMVAEEEDAWACRCARAAAGATGRPVGLLAVTEAHNSIAEWSILFSVRVEYGLEQVPSKQRQGAARPEEHS